MKEDKKIILKVLVGSHAHGLADKDSDYDYRAVYVNPTTKILSLGYNYKGSSWVEGNEDNTAYEIGHFLQLAIKGNPTILEVFKAPIVEINEDGKLLRKLFPYVWTPNSVFNAWTGYGYNQRKKFLEDKDNRANKYAVAWIRTLYQLIQLLETGTWDVEIKDKSLNKSLRKYKGGYYTKGEVIDASQKLLGIAKNALNLCSDRGINYNHLNDFLLYIRKKYWK